MWALEFQIMTNSGAHLPDVSALLRVNARSNSHVEGVCQRRSPPAWHCLKTPSGHGNGLRRRKEHICAVSLLEYGRNSGRTFVDRGAEQKPCQSRSQIDSFYTFSNLVELYTDCPRSGRRPTRTPLPPRKGYLTDQYLPRTQLKYAPHNFNRATIQPATPCFLNLEGDDANLVTRLVGLLQQRHGRALCRVHSVQGHGPRSVHDENYERPGLSCHTLGTHVRSLDEHPPSFLVGALHASKRVSGRVYISGTSVVRTLYR